MLSTDQFVAKFAEALQTSLQSGTLDRGQLPPQDVFLAMCTCTYLFEQVRNDVPKAAEVEQAIGDVQAFLIKSAGPEIPEDEWKAEMETMVPKLQSIRTNLQETPAYQKYKLLAGEPAGHA